MTTDPNKTPGQVAYEAWQAALGHKNSVLTWDELRHIDQQHWHAVANAVIRQVKSIIADEVVKVIHRSGNN